jgi:hypothetical protein
MIQTHYEVYRDMLHPRTEKHVIFLLENPISIKGIEIKTVIQPLVLYGCKTWPLISRADTDRGYQRRRS